MAATGVASGHVEAVRRFNRFYTNTIGLLDETLTASPFTLSEARVLFELGYRDDAVATDIARTLRLDPAYLTRILRRLGEQGLVERAEDDRDARRRPLRLTSAGLQALSRLQADARGDVERLIAGLQPAVRDRLVEAMNAIETLLSPGRTAANLPLVIRQHRVGDISWIVHRQAVLYAREYGWNIEYEGLAAAIVGDFLRDFKPGRENCWVAERGGDIVGSVFLVEEDAETGKLRLLYVEPSARGHGIGGKLVAECIAGARAAGYRRLILWTNDVLTSARRIYEATGFRLVREEPHHSFGKDLNGQYWEMDL